MLLLHLSDIHFRKDEVGTAMDPNAHLRNELVRDAEAMCTKLGAAPDSVLISGDIAFAGNPEEYAYALTWLEDLCSRCGTKLASVFVIPGNHDIAREVANRNVIRSLHHTIKTANEISLEGVIRGLLTDPETRRLLYEALDPYNLFAQQFFCSLLPPDNTIAQRDLDLNDGSILRLSGLNSVFVSSVADKPGDLFVDTACFQIKRERGVEHLVMCHHPYPWLRQGELLQDHLNDVARIHLFGHQHTNRIEMGRDWVRVAASAAHPDRTERGWEPGYNLIQLQVGGSESDRRLDIRVHVRVWQMRPGEFRAKTNRGADVFQQEIELEPWTAPASTEVLVQTSSAEAPTLTGDHATAPEPARSDPMDTLRDISVRFFKLSLSKKSAIAGKLDLLEEEDLNQPDFERFRRVFLRARQRGLIEDLDREVKAAAGGGRS
jgi:GTPase-associated adaptor domain/Calcineurin-like phosphoesterase